MSHAEPKKQKGKVFFARLFSTLVLWAIVTTIYLSANPLVFVGILILLTFLAMLEWKKLWTPSKVDSWCMYWMMFVGIAYLMWTGWDLYKGAPLSGFGKELMALVAAAGGAVAFRLRKKIEGKEAIFSVITTTTGVFYLAICFGGGLIHLADFPKDFRAGVLLVFVVVMATKFTDMGAYLVGSLFGRHKMIPHISPKKTWEGFAGALAFSFLVLFGGKMLATESLAWLPGGLHLVFFSLIIALAAVLGDLAESLLKRSLAQKDSGQVLPGIGGILDLIDSICFAAPAAYVFLRATVGHP